MPVHTHLFNPGQPVPVIRHRPTRIAEGGKGANNMGYPPKKNAGSQVLRAGNMARMISPKI